MNIIKDETGVYVELPRESIKFDSKEAEIIYDLTLENDRLEQELQRKDNNWNELKEWVEKQVLMETPLYGWTFKSMLNKIKELEENK